MPKAARKPRRPKLRRISLLGPRPNLALSLKGVDFEAALKAAMETKLPPKSRKPRKPKREEE